MKNNIPKTVEEFAATKNYLNPSLLYSFEHPISEYDISKANINILRSYNVLDETNYYKLLDLPKMDREKEIGMKIRLNWTIQETIDKGIAASKLQFLKQNNIPLESILRIANDAFYLIGDIPVPHNIVIPEGGTTPITFAHKKTYRYYLKLNSLLVFIDNSGRMWDIDVIGIGNDNIPLHEAFMTFICNLIDQYAYGGKETAIRFFNEYHQNYVSRKLPVENYREFNSFSAFRYDMKGTQYLSITPMSDESLCYLDISHNLNILRTIYSYLLAS